MARPRRRRRKVRPVSLPHPWDRSKKVQWLAHEVEVWRQAEPWRHEIGERAARAFGLAGSEVVRGQE